MNNAADTTTGQQVLDVLTGKKSPTFDFNVSVEDNTILKMIGAGILIGIVVIILNKIADRLI